MDDDDDGGGGGGGGDDGKIFLCNICTRALPGMYVFEYDTSSNNIIIKSLVS